MSTKLFHGYCIPEMPLVDLHNFVMECRKSITGVAQKLFNRIVAVHAAGVFDICSAGYPDKANSLLGDRKGNTVSPMYSSLMFVLDSIKNAEKSMYRDSIYDLSCNISIHPGDGKLLVLLYCQRKEIEKAWKRISGVEPYPYWDNTDKPARISKRDWENRGNEWEKAIGQFNSVPAMNGFNCKLADDLFSSTKDVIHFIPNLRDRQKILTGHLLDMHFDREKKEEIKKLAAEEKWMDIFRLRKAYTESESGKAALESFKDIISSMKPKITREDLSVEFKTEQVKEQNAA